MSYEQAIRSLDALTTVYRKTPRIVGGLAVRFFSDRFRFQGFIDKRFEPWKERKNPDKKKPRRQLLIKTARLIRSPRVIFSNVQRVIVGTDVPYAKAQNDGFKGTVTQNVRTHQRRIRVRKIGKRGNKLKGFTKVVTTVKGFTRKMKMNIPSRKFMDKSDFLDRRIVKNLEEEIKQEFKQKNIPWN